MMKLNIMVVAIALALGACASKPAPDDPSKDHYTTATEVKRITKFDDSKAITAELNEIKRGTSAQVFSDSGDVNGRVGIRDKSIYEAGLAYGMQYGLYIRSKSIKDRIKKYESRFDHAVNFQSFIYDSVILSPSISIVKNLEVPDGDTRLVRTAVVYQVEDEARIVTGAPTFRDYLYLPFEEPKAVHPALKPKTSSEQRSWATGVDKGYHMGVEQAGQVFEDNMNRMLADHEGRVNYRRLVNSGVLSPASLRVTNNTVTVNGRALHVGETIVEIDNKLSFESDDNWRSAWQVD